MDRTKQNNFSLLANGLAHETSLFRIMVGLSYYKLVLHECPSVIDLSKGSGLGFHANNKGRLGT